MIGFLDGSEAPHLGVRVDGDVSEKDFAALAELLEEQIEGHGRIRLLVQLDSLGRIEPGALWDDVRFTFRHLRDIERVALVGDAFWQGAYTRLASPLFPGELRHFRSGQLTEAWDWLRRND